MIPCSLTAAPPFHTASDQLCARYMARKLAAGSQECVRRRGPAALHGLCCLTHHHIPNSATQTLRTVARSIFLPPPPPSRPSSAPAASPREQVSPVVLDLDFFPPIA